MWYYIRIRVNEEKANLNFLPLLAVQSHTSMREHLNIRCLIHNAHLGKILSFNKILDLKITRLKEYFDYYFCLTSVSVIKAWHSKEKTITLLHRIVSIL
jgi:hypothetical protein